MTEHGFGKVTIESENPPTQATIRYFAREISKVPGVIRAHIQKPEGSPGSARPRGDWKINQIIFEFGHVVANYEEYQDHDAFFNKITSIQHPKHSITKLEYWIIEDSVP